MKKQVQKWGMKVTAADLFVQLQDENERLQEENIKLKSDVSFWKPLACGALSALFGVLGAAVGFYIMVKIDFL